MSVRVWVKQFRSWRPDPRLGALPHWLGPRGPLSILRWAVLAARELRGPRLEAWATSWKR